VRPGALGGCTSQLSTQPSQCQQSTAGSLNYSVDLTAQLAPGEVPTLPLVTLYDITAASQVAGLLAPTLANVGPANADPQWVWQLTLAGSSLVAAHQYRMLGTYTASSGKQPAFETIILCLDPTRAV